MGSSNANAGAERREEQRLARIGEGRTAIDQQFAGFDDSFFNRLGQASLDLNLPSVDRQFEESQDGLLAALARLGQLQGTESSKRFAQLSADRTTALGDANALASETRQSARQQVEAERRTLTSQLQATDDPELAAAGAASAATALREQPPTQEIGTLFENTVQGLGVGAIPQFDRNGNSIGSPFGRLFRRSGTGSGTGRTVN